MPLQYHIPQRKDRLNYELISKLETVGLKNHPELNETWVQQKIEEDPQLLELGELDFRGKERQQPGGGRLDLLLENPDGNHRYEVEIQLGATDPSHIIRTLEYWDRERKRYPQYKHTAVLVAEHVTGRFLNVISLFNGHIPFVAIQMKAVKTEKGIGLLFTKVLDEFELGLVDEDEEGAEPTDREYWIAKSSKASVELADRLLALVNEFDSSQALKYNKGYIGLAKDGKPNNFVYFVPKKAFIRVVIKLAKSSDTEGMVENAGLEISEYDSRNERYRIRLWQEDIEKHRDIIGKLIRAAHDEWNQG